MTTRLHEILVSHYDTLLVKLLLEAYEQAKRNFFIGGHRLNAVEGGRFCEAAFRLLQQQTTGSFTPVGEQLNTEKIIAELSRVPAREHSKLVRIYLPRALRVVYDIRNSRNAAHLAHDIYPNLQDATFVMATLDWVLAEFVRLSGKADANAAQALVTELVTRKYPAIQIFGNRPKVLRADLRAGDHALVLLYFAGSEGTSVPELTQWVPHSMRANLKRTLKTLEQKVLVHQEDDQVTITRAGERRIEVARLLDLP